MNDQTALQIAKEVASIYLKSFVSFSTSWKSLPEDNPIPGRRRPQLRMLVREMKEHGYVNNSRSSFLSRVVKRVYDGLLYREIAPRFSGLKDKYLFLANVFTLHIYFKEVLNWFREILSALGSGFLEDFCGEIDNYTQSRFYGTFVMRLKDCCFSVVHDLRNSHSYNSSWVYCGVAALNFKFYTDRMTHYFENRDLREHWADPYCNLTCESVRQLTANLPDDINEHDFVALAIVCTETEASYLGEVFLPNWTAVRSVLSNIFLKAYHERVEQKKFKSLVALLAAPELEFEPNVISNLTILHVNAKKRKQFIKKYLKSEIGKKVCEWAIDNIDKCLQLAEQGDRLKEQQVTLTELLRYLDLLKSRLRSFLPLHLQPIMALFTKAVKYFEKPNAFSAISDQGTIQSIRRAGQLFAQALCGIHGAQVSLSHYMEFLCDFFILLADQKNFMDEIRSALQRQIRAGYLSNLSSLRFFLQSNKIVGLVPDSLSHLMRDIEHSGAFLSSFQNHPIAISSDILGSRTLVLRERDERKDFENLLVRPEEVSGIHKAFENHIKEGLHFKENLKALNCFSFITIRTSLFSGTSGSIKIRLMVYQYSVLELLQEGEQLLVQDVYKTLIHPDVKDENALRAAAQLVNKVLLSLIQPHPLIKVSSGRAEISSQDRIMLNSDFVYDKDILCVEPAILVAQTTKVQVQQPPTRSERSKFKVGVAKMIIKNRLSQGPVREQELFDFAVKKARRNNLQVEDVQAAFQLMLEKNLITRVGDSMEYVKYLPEREERL